MKDVLARIGVVTVWLLIGAVGVRYAHVVEAAAAPPSKYRSMTRVWIIGGPLTAAVSALGGLLVDLRSPMPETQVVEPPEQVTR